LNTPTVDSLLFNPEAQSAFWEEMQPDARACLDFFESKERWPYKYDEFPELFVQMAEVLPRVAGLPVDESSQEILVTLIPLLSSMPFRQCIFAIHWLNHQAGESPIGWGALCYLEAVNITNNSQDHQYFGMAKALVDRMATVMRTRKIIGLFSQWPLKTA
jgi:hypothetical protein